ncbi:MAG TPA: glycosyltransferase family 4 protein [Steroidobacteraceae bacterium]|nr:glycosyltransferase family 4 protein [Steroidobacteraceae bacterium]
MKKRILYIEGNTDGTVGGSYYLLFDLVSRLDREKFEPIVGFHRDNFLIERFKALGVETIVFSNPTPWVPKGFLFRSVLAPLKKLVNLYRGLFVPAREYAQFLRERRIDLVNLNNSITRNHAWMLAARRTHTRCMTHEMGIRLHFSTLARFFGKRLEKIVCLSHAIHDNMKRLGVDYPNTVVIHCGIDLERYHVNETPAELRAKHNIPADSEVVGVVGNIREWKGQVVMVRAAALLKQKFPRLRVLLVGDCGAADKSYGDMLAKLCRELGLEETVIFTGFQKNAIDYMGLMDVVAHTSVHPEPFGIVTLEAMSLSKPLVSTTHGGPAEVVVNGETGLLVEAGKPELLANAIGSLLADRAKATEFGRKGYERLNQHFGIRKNIDATMAVYRSVLRLPEAA